MLCVTRRPTGEDAGRSIDQFMTGSGLFAVVVSASGSEDASVTAGETLRLRSGQAAAVQWDLVFGGPENGLCPVQAVDQGQDHEGGGQQEQGGLSGG